MAKRTPKTSKAKAPKAPAKARAQKPAAPKPRAKKAAPAKVQPLRSKAADTHRLVKAVEKALTPKAAPKGKAKAPALQVEKVTVTAKAVNPGTASALARAWKAWTGANPGQVLMVKVPAATVDTAAGTVRLPSEVVFLGRLASLITNEAKTLEFGKSGPYLVSDARLEHLWILSQRPHRFDLRGVAIISYLARKPKFGDRGTVEYVHRFDRAARAAMSGQVGLIKGTFRLTPRGIEG